MKTYFYLVNCDVIFQSFDLFEMVYWLKLFWAWKLLGVVCKAEL